MSERPENLEVMAGRMRTSSRLGARNKGLPIHEIIEWDVRNWAHCLEHWAPVVRTLDPASTRVLAIGERHGGLSLWFALLGFRVVCSDRCGPTAQARALHARYGVDDRVVYEAVDVFDMKYPSSTFDVVACKSVIGGLKEDYRDPSTRTLERQRRAVREIRRVLRPGGYFLAAENLRGSALHQWARRRMKGGRIGWRHLTLWEVGDVLHDFEKVAVCPFGFLGTRVTALGLDALSSVADTVLAKVLPHDWMYIAFIRAKAGGQEASGNP